MLVRDLMRPSFRLHRITDSTKLGGLAGTPYGCAAIESDLDREESLELQKGEMQGGMDLNHSLVCLITL